MLLAQAALAQSEPTLAYRVKKGDTLDLIAAEFYGDRSRAQFIVTENKLKNAHAFTPGDRLRIPVSREITTAKGDKFDTLSGTYLGDARRAQFLADFNNLPVDDSLATGTTLTIPFHVTHTAQSTESLAQIATAYFGDARQSDMLRRYNFLDHSQIEKGDSIVVPELVLRVRAAKLPALDSDAKQRRDAQHKAEADAQTELPRARAAWQLGDFDTAKDALDKIGPELEYLDTATAVEAGLLLGRTNIAFDKSDVAVKAFAQVLERKPRQVLSAYAESPKVLAAWKKAGGHVEGE